MLIKIKCFPVLFLLVTCVFLFAGCTININVGNPSNNTENETISNHNSDTSANISIYQSCATIMLSTIDTDKAAISSSDLVVSVPLVKTYATILQSNQIQGKIHEEYPGVEYELTLEQINETEVCSIIATGENPEHLEEICNMAVSLLCEQIPQIVEGFSCKVVDYAKQPVQ